MEDRDWRDASAASPAFSPSVPLETTMPDPAPNAELMRSLGRLVRGLSALFWGLPAALLICFHTARAEVLQTFGVLPPLLITGLLAYGLKQLSAFQKQERVWQSALDRARLLSLINLGLSPFLYWSNRVPGNTFFLAMVIVMTFSGVLFMVALNLTLQRLGAMLPDESLRLDIKQFTAVNLNLLGVIFVLALIGVFLSFGHNLTLYRQISYLPQAIQYLLTGLETGGTAWLPLLLSLMPLAMTMALLWKTKEVILDNVFSAKANNW